MTVRHRKKSSRRFGKTTQGYGSRKKHRGAGNRGGRGMAGTGKRADQRKSWILKEYGLSYFGKRGFHIPPSVLKEENTINIRDLPHQDNIDLTSQGITKLLAKGVVKRKYTIKVPACSPKAKQKIEQAGGRVELAA